MTTVNRHRLCGWSVRCAAAAITLAICASALADPSKNVVTLPKQDGTHKHTKKVCYTYISGSATAQPCDRLGPIPTTAGAMDVVGGSSSTKETRR